VRFHKRQYGKFSTATLALLPPGCFRFLWAMGALFYCEHPANHAGTGALSRKRSSSPFACLHALQLRVVCVCQTQSGFRRFALPDLRGITNVVVTQSCTYVTDKQRIKPNDQNSRYAKPLWSPYPMHRGYVSESGAVHTNVLQYSFW